MSALIGGGAGVPVGTVAAHPAAVPAGWLECDGSAISRTDYAALFNEIGTDYGAGDGSTTFNIPDLRGEFIRGFDNGRGVDSGRALGSSQLDEFKEHSHSNGAVSGSTISSNSGFVYALGNTGLAGGTETRPRNVAMYQCIKY